MRSLQRSRGFSTPETVEDAMHVVAADVASTEPGLFNPGDRA
jgi:hypothetical protein